jgi:hypothetical protein
MDTKQSNQSEVARLRAQIEQEYQAAQMFKAFALGTAKHEFITARMERIGVHQAALAQLVGEEASMVIVCGIFDDDSSPQQSHCIRR